MSCVFNLDRLGKGRKVKGKKGKGRKGNKREGNKREEKGRNREMKLRLFVLTTFLNLRNGKFSLARRFLVTFINSLYSRKGLKFTES